MSIAGNGVRKYQLVLGALFAAATVAYLLMIHHMGIESDVVRVYFPYADELMHGSIPVMEYPPFALVFLAVPRLFASTPLGYEIVFSAEVFVFFMVGLIVIGKLAKRYHQSQYLAMLVYAALMLLMVEFVLDRYDIFPAVLTLLSFYCLVTKRYTWAFVLLSIATMSKLYPAVLFPIYLIPFFFNRDWKNVLKGAGAFIITSALIVLPFFLLDSETALHFLSYHMDRPLHVESATASLIELAYIFGLTDVWVEFGYGSDNLMGSWAAAVAPYLLPLTLSVLAAVYALHAYILSKLRTERQDNENNRIIHLSGAVLLAFLAFIIFGKVFSSQYLIWVIPFIALMMMTSISHTSKSYIFVLSILVIALTQLNFAVNIGMNGGGAGITDAGMMIILARNIAAVILFAYVVKVCRESIKKKPWRPHPRSDDRYQKL
ncbi:MAG: DUF2029 domain-containing protein [Candidatus Methanoplasma sp.]|jgi:hypothetical protein|nr:DUF2029 domain-containing protein [Candidatus Methanoplasma sp.]